MALRDIVMTAKKRLIRIVHSFKWGHVLYEPAVGEVGGIITFAEDLVCDIGYSIGASPAVITSLLDELDDLRLEYNTELHKMNMRKEEY